jgi:TRAP-type C4-dicarboxylate transport system permease small subunit
MAKIARIRAVYANVLQSFIGIALGCLVLINLWQVLTRYFVDMIVMWTEDVTVLTLLWMAACGAGWLWTVHDCLAMDVADFLLPKKVLHMLDYLVEVMGLIGGPVIFYIAINALNANAGIIMSVLQFDEKIRYYPVVFMGFAIFVASVLRLLELIENDRKGKE